MTGSGDIYTDYGILRAASIEALAWYMELDDYRKSEALQGNVGKRGHQLFDNLNKALDATMTMTELEAISVRKTGIKTRPEFPIQLSEYPEDSDLTNSEGS